MWELKINNLNIREKKQQDGQGVVVLKELIFTVSTFGQCGGVETTDFYSFYFGWVWWS